MSLTPDQERVIGDIWQAKSGFELGVIAERERIINLITNDWAEYPDVEWLIALIKGENKANPWTSRPLTEEDKEHYGLEGENK